MSQMYHSTFDITILGSFGCHVGGAQAMFHGGLWR